MHTSSYIRTYAYKCVYNYFAVFALMPLFSRKECNVVIYLKSLGSPLGRYDEEVSRERRAIPYISRLRECFAPRMDRGYRWEMRRNKKYAVSPFHSRVVFCLLSDHPTMYIRVMKAAAYYQPYVKIRHGYHDTNHIIYVRYAPHIISGRFLNQAPPLSFLQAPLPAICEGES